MTEQELAREQHGRYLHHTIAEMSSVESRLSAALAAKMRWVDAKEKQHGFDYDCWPLGAYMILASHDDNIHDLMIALRSLNYQKHRLVKLVHGWPYPEQAND